jgi:hypothetical protein
VFRVRPGTWLRILLDDEISYGRSALSERGETPREEELDRTTCLANPCAHIPRGEFQAGILIPR